MQPIRLDRKLIKKVARMALSEDLGRGDITTNITISPDCKAQARIVSNAAGVISGLEVVKAVFKLLDKSLKFKSRVTDGASVKPGAVVGTLIGNACAVLSGERTALNFLAHLSGIATLTRKFSQKIKPYEVKLLDTRKTTPGLRHLEKYAVKMGGGYNHREGLWKGILVKDNHLNVYEQKCPDCKNKLDSIKHIVRQAKSKRLRGMHVEVEVNNLKEFKTALKSRPDIIMLDNMRPEQIKRAVSLKRKLGKNVILEVSGGVNLNNVRKIAALGVDWISIGMLTQSAPSLDLSLEIARVF